MKTSARCRMRVYASREGAPAVSRDNVRATQDKNNRPGPDAAELYKTPVKDKLRRKLSPYVSFEERDTDLFHMCRVSVVNELELVTWSLRWRRCDGVVPRRRRCGRQRAFVRAAAPDAVRIGGLV